MGSAIVMRPREGSKLDLALVLAIFILSLPLFIYLPYYVLVIQGEEAASMTFLAFMMAIALILVSDRPGRYVIMDQEGISRPVLVRTYNPKLIPFEGITEFEEEYHYYDKETVVGIRIAMKGGKKIRYLERQTPGSCKVIADLLEKKGIPKKSN